METAIAAAAVIGCAVGCTVGMALVAKLAGRFYRRTLEQDS